MIDSGLMRKTDDDTPEDFRAVFDFDEAFRDLTTSTAVKRMPADGGLARG